MLRLVADENFDNDIIRGLLREKPDLDLVRVQDVGLSAIEDPIILAWAADEGRILLTHDVRTMTHFAHTRTRESQAMPGMFLVKKATPIGQAIQDLLILIECSTEGEWNGLVVYVPLH